MGTPGGPACPAAEYSRACPVAVYKAEGVEPERAEILLDLRRKQRVEPDKADIRFDPKEKWQVEQEMAGIRIDAA